MKLPSIRSKNKNMEELKSYDEERQKSMINFMSVPLNPGQCSLHISLVSRQNSEQGSQTGGVTWMLQNL